MVLVHVKRGDKNEFLFETTTDTSNDALSRALCRVNNARLRLQALADALPGLAKYGVAKSPNEQGLDQYQEDNQTKPRGEFYEPDPMGMRTGEGVGPQLTSVLTQVAEDAKQYLNSQLQVAQKVAMKQEILDEKLMNIRGATMMAFPMGLPAYDPIKILLDAQDVEKALAESSAVLDATPEDTTEVWWAGKQFFRDQYVRDLVGKNEKTKIVVKLQKKGAGMPAREAAVSEDERKAMMAFYFKKQEELKKLADDDAEDYMTSSWADPKQLKNSLRGTNNIRPF
jgi:cilia- and flagella-associated protein 298